MLDIGWSELLLIGIVALIVVGPRDLPNMFRQLGRITAKLRSMGNEFSRAMQDAAKEAGIDDTMRDLKSATSKKALGLDALENAASTFEKWQPMKPKSAPKGPATQALADKKAAEAAERAAKAGSAVAPAEPVAPIIEPPAPSTPKRAPKLRSNAKAKAEKPSESASEAKS